MRAAARVERSIQAPAEKRSTDEIVAEIMKEVKYLPVEVYVRRLIDDLRAGCSPFTGSRRDNKEYLSDLRKWTDKGKTLLSRAPRPLAAAVFAPERFESLYPLHGTALGINPRTRDYLAQDPERLSALNSELDRIRARCDELARRDLGKHAGAKSQQHHAAIASRTVLEAVASQTGTKLSLSRSATGKYCKVARLFFEAATGKHNENLQRACEAVARDPFATPFFTQNG